MNNVTLMGRLARDPEIRQTKSGSSTATFTVAVDRYNPNGDNTADFIRCVAFGKTAELIEKHFSKGSAIALDGNIKTGSYKKDDGTTVYTTDVWVSRVEFVPSSGKTNSQSAGEQDEKSQKASKKKADDAFEDVDEDIPF